MIRGRKFSMGSAGKNKFTPFMINDILRSSPGERGYLMSGIGSSFVHGKKNDPHPNMVIQLENSLSPSSSRTILSSSFSSSVSPNSFRSEPSSPTETNKSSYWNSSSICPGSLDLSNGRRRGCDEKKMKWRGDEEDQNQVEEKQSWNLDPMIQTLFWHNLLVKRKELMSSNKSRKGGQIRFTPEQTIVLEKRFSTNKYIGPVERKRISKQIGLNERQVKTWFQNRRAKWRRSSNPNSTEVITGNDTKSGNFFNNLFIPK